LIGDFSIVSRLALPLLAVVIALAPAVAWGAADVIGNSKNQFDKPTYFADEGELVQYKHSGSAPHNVVSTQTSRGEPLFKSATISDGKTPVNGTELLAPGTYPFVCTLHNGMAAELVIRDTAPPPPSNTTPPDDTTPPDNATVEGSATTKKTQKQKGKKILVKVTVKANEDLDAKGSGKVKVNPTYKLKTQTKSISEGKSKTLKLKPKKSKDAKKISKYLRRGKKATAKLKVKLTDEAGNTETEKLTVKLKR
jgi:plastocyanin